MKAAKKSFRDPPQMKAIDVLQTFIEIFESRGWLNQTIRIRLQERRYRISCTETGFVAYRINDHCGVSPGIPGWPVCFVTQDHMMEDSDMSRFASNEPSILDWLRFITDSELELI
jgi:hypothetical protein